MPLLEIKRSKKVTATVGLEESTARLTDSYASYAQVSADDVVNKALEYVFEKDKDFQKFLEKSADAKPAEGLRVRGSSDAEPKSKRLTAAG